MVRGEGLKDYIRAKRKPSLMNLVDFLHNIKRITPFQLDFMFCLRRGPSLNTVLENKRIQCQQYRQNKGTILKSAEIKAGKPRVLYQLANCGGKYGVS